MRLFICLFILSLSIFFHSCTPKISTTVTMPAKSSEAGKLKNIAVLPFNGNLGEKITPEIENILTRIAVNNKSYFRVVDRNNIAKVMQEQNFQMAGITEKETAVKFGKILGVAGIYLGQSDQHTEESYYYNTRHKCITRDSDGNCKNWREYEERCKKRELNVTILPKLVNVGTSEIVYSEKHVYTATDKWCPSDSNPISSANKLRNIAIQKTLRDFRHDIAPYKRNVAIKLMDEDEGINTKKGKNLLKNAIEFAENNRMDRSCKMWKKGFDRHPDSISFVYNYGVCLEIQGKYKNALEYYQKADNLTNKPIDTINKALQRIEKRISDQNALKKQLTLKR